MSADYSMVENEVLSVLVARFPGKLSESRCVATDIDKLFSALLGEDADYGCIIDYGGAEVQNRAPFNKSVWATTINGIFFIRHKGDNAVTDKNVRDVISTLPSIFSQDRRLGGLVDLISITKIGEPEPGTLNDVPFYALMFSLETLNLL